MEQEQKTTTRRKKLEENMTGRTPSIACDVGTGFCVCATNYADGIKYRTQRDAFLDLENNAMSKDMLKRLNAPFIEAEDKKELYAIGDDALKLSDFLNRECRRPLAHGVISTRETKALAMIKVILHNLVGDPIVQNEKLCFSIPADPIDANFNNIYHVGLLKSFFESFGFTAEPMNEAFAIIFSELSGEEDYTGMALSFGSGAVNICLSFLGISEKEQQFSISRSGDYIDENAGRAIGVKTSRITTIKEMGIDLLNPKTREETAIKFYYENLIKYTCNAIEKKFKTSENVPNFPESITVVLSGGTSKAINFDKLFEREIMSRTFPFKIKNIKKAADPLNAVAKGCLLHALTN